MKKERLYHVVVKNIKTGDVVIMTSYPVVHATAMIILKKIGKHPGRIETVMEVHA